MLLCVYVCACVCVCVCVCRVCVCQSGQMRILSDCHCTTVNCIHYNSSILVDVSFLQQLLQVLAVLVITVVANVYMLIAGGAIIVVLCGLQYYFVPQLVKLRRLEAASECIAAHTLYIRVHHDSLLTHTHVRTTMQCTINTMQCTIKCTV